ncbi:cysteine hydrolase family protein [Camelimonas abortus]|uniref:Cysteine hydrolase family protein n=1 Tax=Camelimonas abortus TaxID=1017184 RepID=A0ABV7LF10_9HYPH
MSTLTEAPRTLLSIAGIAPRQPRLSQATLVVIDAQNEYRSGALPLAGIDQAVGRLALLLKRARAAGTPVIHVRQLGRPGGLFDPESSGGGFIEETAPLEGERVVTKRLPNAFQDTDLKAILDAHGRPQLLLAGFMTHMCVSATARSALDHGLTASFVVADATATRALPDPGESGVVPAADVQRVALAEIADRFAEVVHSDAIAA